MCQWIGSALVKTMAWCQIIGQHWLRQWLVTYFAPSHYLNQCWVIAIWALRNKLQWNFNQNKKLFIHENTSENIVCEPVAILSRGRWVKSGHGWPPNRLAWAVGHASKNWTTAGKTRSKPWLLMTWLISCHGVWLCSHIEAETRWPPFPRQHFQMDFLEWKCMNCD